MNLLICIILVCTFGLLYDIYFLKTYDNHIKRHGKGYAIFVDILAGVIATIVINYLYNKFYTPPDSGTTIGSVIAVILTILIIYYGLLFHSTRYGIKKIKSKFKRICLLLFCSITIVSASVLITL